MKNSTLRQVTAAAVVAAIGSLCVAAGTYARYASKATAADASRIAKWGVELSASGNLYGEQYGEDGAIEVYDELDKAAVRTASKGTDIIAPGTKHTGGLRFALGGTPEVKTQIDAVIKSENIYLKKGTYAIAQQIPDGAVTAAGYDNMQPKLYYLSEGTYKTAPADYDETVTKYYTMENEVTLSEDYYPVVYSSTHMNSSDISSDSLGDIAENIAQKLGSPSVSETEGITIYTVSAQYDPGTDLGTTLQLSEESIGWKWSYMQGEEGSATEKMYSGADTILGSIGSVPEGSEVLKSTANGYIPVEQDTDYHLSTSFDMTVSVTQVN